MNKVTAIDPGTEHTGLTTFDGKVTKTYTIRPNNNVYGFAKLYTMAKNICKHIEPNDFVVMEDYGFGGNFFNYQVPELVSMLKLYMLKKKSNSLMTIAPNTAKKIITGKGNASKKVMSTALVGLAKQHKIKFGTNHESDSFGMMICYFQYSAGSLDSATMRSLESRIIDFRKQNV